MIKMSIKEIAQVFKDLDSPLGDLCSDIVSDKDFPENDENGFHYLYDVSIGKEYLDDPIFRLKIIYLAINR